MALGIGDACCITRKEFHVLADGVEPKRADLVITSISATGIFSAKLKFRTHRWRGKYAYQEGDDVGEES